MRTTKLIIAMILICAGSVPGSVQDIIIFQRCDPLQKNVFNWSTMSVVPYSDLWEFTMETYHRLAYNSKLSKVNGTTAIPGYVYKFSIPLTFLFHIYQGYHTYEDYHRYEGNDRYKGTAPLDLRFCFNFLKNCYCDAGIFSGTVAGLGPSYFDLRLIYFNNPFYVDFAPIPLFSLTRHEINLSLGLYL